MSLSLDDAGRFGALMRAYADSYYPERNLSDEAICLYFEELRSCAFDDISRALSAHVRSERCGRFPKPGDLLRHMSDAGEAALAPLWRDVLAQIRRVGRYGKPTFQDARTALAIEAMGGWEVIVQCPTEEDLAVRQREFMKAAERQDRVLALKG